MKVPQLTCTRFLAALLIVVSHLPSKTLHNTPVLGALLEKAPAAVSYFFLLSGFILVVSNASGTTLPPAISRRQFWINRFARIYPLYLFAFVLTFLLTFLSLQTEKGTYSYSVTAFLLEFTLLQAWTSTWEPMLNYPSWSLSVELVFYFIFPFLYQWLVRKHSISIVLTAVLIWIVNQSVYIYCFSIATPANFCLYFPLLHLSTFICGISAGIVTIRNWTVLLNYRRSITCLFLGIALLTGYLIVRKVPVMAYYHDGLLSPVFILLILFLIVEQGPLSRWFSHPKLIYLGEISYGVYLLQVPVGIGLYYVNQSYLRLSPQQYIPFYILFLLLTAALCFQIIEIPARRLLRSWLSSTPAVNQKFIREPLV